MCGVWIKGVDRELQELTTEEYLDLFEQMKDIGVRLVTLTGGEPFIRKDLFEIVEAAKSQDLICNIFTNGTLIDNSAAERIFRYGIDKIIISVDGIGPVHDSIRGVSGSFDEAIGALRDIGTERRARGTKKPEIDIHMTLLKENIGDMTQLSILCQKLGVNFSFQPYSESYEQAVEQTLFGGETIGSVRYLPHHETLRFSEEAIHQIRGELDRLPMTFYTRLLSSFSDEDLRYVIVGNIRNERLLKIWRGKRYETLRKKLSQHLFPLCANCCHCADNLNLMQLIKIISRKN